MSMPARETNRKRLLLFKAISIVIIPLCVLALAELILRIVGYGNDYRVFITYPHDSRYLVFNPEASARYFPDAQSATVGNVELFKKKKGPGTFRIFVLGESTTVGYPYFHNGAFHRWLAYRLMHDYPGRTLELINLSLTAVNSYTVRGFAREVAKYQPDAVLIYTGHNEYYGALGVGSTQQLGGNPHVVNFLLKLRSLRLVQLMTQAWLGVRHLVGHRSPAAGVTRMEMMAARQEIPLGSPLFLKGLRQFTVNMRATLQMLSERHIPVFLSDVVSNESGLAPFISVAPQSGGQGFFKAYHAGLRALREKDTIQAFSLLSRAENIDSAYAACNFYLAEACLQRQDFHRAAHLFSAARDLDALRFRAPDTLNKIIAHLCSLYPGVHMVHTEAVFREHADHGIIGSKLILDHVHPNLLGYAFMSQAFFFALRHTGILPPPASGDMGLDSLLKKMPLTAVDTLTGAFRMEKLRESWPFNQTGGEISSPETLPQRLAYGIAFQRMPWETAMRTLYEDAVAHRRLPEAARISEAMVLEHPTDPAYDLETANLYGKLGDPQNAVFYFARAFALAPDFDKARYIFVIYLQMDRPDLALPYLDYAASHNTSGYDLAPVRQLCEEIAGLKEKLKTDTADISLMMQIARSYERMNNRTGAARYAGRILAIDPGNRDALAIRDEVNTNQSAYESR